MQMPNTLDHYLKRWHLSDPQPLAQTPTSHVYRVMSGNEPVVLKLLTPVGVADEATGATALRYWRGEGAVRLLRSDAQAHLLEYAEGEPVAALVERDHDAQATVIIGGVLRQLHSITREPPAGLVPLRVRFRSLFARAAAAHDSIYSRAARVAEALLADPVDERVLHGDIHHNNIRCRAGRGWLALDPKGLLGERTFDAANTLCNPLYMPYRPDLVCNEARLLANAAILACAISVTRERLLAFTFAYACLSSSWFLDDGNPEAATDMRRVAELAEPHLPR